MPFIKKKKIIEHFLFTSLIFVIIAVSYMLQFLLKTKMEINVFFYELYIFRYFRVLTLMIWILGLTYRLKWSFDSFGRNSFKLKFITIITSFCLFCNLFFLFLEKTVSFYKKIKANVAGYTHPIYKRDDQLGIAAIPNAYSEYYSYCENVPICTNELALRFPCKAEQKIPERTDILALGCSFTWGNGVVSEKSYPFLLGDLMNKKVLNAAENGFGLAGMLIQAKKLLPQYSPDYILIQYSSWLTKRAQRPVLPYGQGFIAYPYISYSENRLSVQAPVFKTSLPLAALNDFKNTKTGVLDFLSFFVKCGIRSIILDQFKYWLVQFKMIIGLLPSPCQDTQKIERYVFNELNKLAEEHNVIPVVVHLGSWLKYENYSENTFQDMLPPNLSKDFLFVKSDSILNANLSGNETYERKYLIWKETENDTILCNSHPNALAHEIIANSIFKEITK